jgi:hypothetical protein
LLRASDREGHVFHRNRSEPIEFGAAKLGRGGRLATTAATDRPRIKRHRVFARADQDMSGKISHPSHNYL